MRGELKNEIRTVSLSLFDRTVKVKLGSLGKSGRLQQIGSDVNLNATARGEVIRWPNYAMSEMQKFTSSARLQGCTPAAPLSRPSRTSLQSVRTGIQRPRSITPFRARALFRNGSSGQPPPRASVRSASAGNDPVGGAES